jgi:hypothetical protein
MDRTRKSACPVDCPGCTDPDPAAEVMSSPLSGWALAGASLLTFLVPLLGALTGAAALGPGSLAQLAGSVGGLLVGAVIVHRWIPALARRGRGAK